MIIKFAALVTVLGMVAAVGSVTKADEKTDQALQVTEQWLALVDAGNYAESWESAADYFKGVVQKAQWEQAIKGVREPLGEVGSRDVKSRQYATSLPGAPDGEYVVIQFVTAFQNKSSAVETVTPMLDKDGQWRVSGYYIK